MVHPSAPLGSWECLGAWPGAFRGPLFWATCQAMRKLEREFEKTKDTLNKERLSVESALLDFSSDVDKEQYKRELSVVSGRLRAMEYVMATGPGASKCLSEYLDAFAQLDDKASTRAGSGPIDDGKGENPLAKAAPCYNYQYLETLDQLQSRTELSATLVTEKSLLDEEQKHLLYFRAGQELAKACSKA
eukprot:3196811-Pyramimonas_sp.AAC.1